MTCCLMATRTSRDLPLATGRHGWKPGWRKKQRLDLSGVLDFASWDELAGLRRGAAVQGHEGLMIKRKDSRYVAGRPKGPWFKWKRDPRLIDT